jgi:hypothetical protein
VVSPLVDLQCLTLLLVNLELDHHPDPRVLGKGILPPQVTFNNNLLKAINTMNFTLGLILI